MDWKLETDVNYYVKGYLDKLGLEKLVDYNDETSMSDYMKEALKGSAKTEKKRDLEHQTFMLKHIIYLLLLKIN